MMEKKTREKSKILNILILIMTVIAILIVLSAIGMLAVNKLKSYQVKQYNEKIMQEEESKKNNTDITYKLDNGKEQKYINSYGYILEDIDSTSKTIHLLDTTIKNIDETINSKSLENVNKIYITLKQNGLLDDVTTIIYNNENDIQLKMHLENKIVHLGNTENLSTKLMYAKTIMEQEQGNKGDVFVKDINKVYFSENID